MIHLNNEKRKQLNEKNLKDYEDMLVYIRLSTTKSEQQTEEILLELLDHILIAQKEGKSVRDVFGEDLKTYAQELIDEIPEETRKKQFKFAGRLILIFLAVSSLFTGIIHPLLYYVWEIGELNLTLHLGSTIVRMIINVIIAFAAIYVIIEKVKNSAFNQKKRSAWIEFFQFWGIMTFVMVLFLCVTYFMPPFGKSFSMPTITFIPLGFMLYGVAYLLKD